MAATELVDDEEQGLERYSLRQLLFVVRSAAGYRVPTNTLRTWRHRIGVSPDEDGCYGRAEVQYLLEYLSFKQQGFTARQFVDYKNGRFDPARM